MRDQARYALICRAEGIVPIVEPDVVHASATASNAVELNVRIPTSSSKHGRPASTSTPSSR